MGGTAGWTGVAYVRAQLGAIRELEEGVRGGEEDSVHRMRVATRRSRSALTSFRRELDPSVTEPVRAELKWLASVLGAERDREVLAERLGARFAELGEGLGTDVVRGRLHALAEGDAGAAHAAVLRTLDGDRYAALLAALDGLTTAPPYLPAAGEEAGPAALRTVGRDLARLRGLMAAALAAEPGEDRDVALHEARKAAKRARYGGEAVTPVLGTRARAYTARLKRLQQLLGEHQDGVMCRTALAGAAERARVAGEDPAPYEAMLHAELALAAQTEAALPAAWTAADHPV